MFGMSELKQTRVYQEALEEGRQEGELIGKLKAVPRLLAMALSEQQVAEALGLEVEQVRQAAQNLPSELCGKRKAITLFTLPVVNA